MTEPAKLKKSESIEIRLPHPTKQAFMARCRDDGRSASDALRGFIDGYLHDDGPQAANADEPRGGFKGWRLLIAGAVAAALGATVAPALARTTPEPAPSQADFQRLDADHDGKLSLAEFQRLGDLRRR